jgi:large subunit ribosomal protein L10
MADRLADESAGTDTVTVQHSRATVRPDKAATVAELAEAFRGASAAVLTEYRGLTVKQISDLRRVLGADTTYSVVKNTLTRLAATDAGLEGMDALLSGPTAVAFVNGDPVEAAKGLRDFARATPALVVKGGVMDGKALTADEVRKLADLESREVLLGRMAGGLLASLSQAVYLLNAPLAQAARLAEALRAKAEQDPSVLRGGAGTPAADDAAPADGAADAAAGDAPVAPATDATSEVTADVAADEVVAAPAGDAAAAPEAAPAAEAGAAEATAVEGITPAETDSETPTA